MPKTYSNFVQNNNIFNFGDILNHYASQTPKKRFLTDLVLNQEFTYEDFNELVNKTAHYLTQQDLSQGDILSVVLENSWPYLAFYFACIKLGVVVDPFPTSLDPQELKRYIDYAVSNTHLTLPTNREV